MPLDAGHREGLAHEATYEEATEMSGKTQAEMLTFHTNGESPEWAHDWRTAEGLLAEGKAFHTTQIGLIDSHHVRHSYGRFALVDGPNRFVFESDGDRWATESTSYPLRKIHRIAHLWKTTELDVEHGTNLVAWDRSLAQREILAGRELPRRVLDDGSPLTATFCVGPEGRDAIHGWLSARVLVSMGMSLVTTQMDLLGDWQVLGAYDRIVIADGDDRVTLDSVDGTWRSDRTDRAIRPSNDLFSLWRNGEFV